MDETQKCESCGGQVREWAGKLKCWKCGKDYSEPVHIDQRVEVLNKVISDDAVTHNKLDQLNRKLDEANWHLSHLKWVIIIFFFWLYGIPFLFEAGAVRFRF